MASRVCSILVTLLLVLGSTASLAAADDDDKKKKGSESDDGDGGDGDGDEEEDYGEPDAWERPPMEEEKPAPKTEAAPPPVKRVGDGKPIMVGAVVGWGFNTDRNNAGMGADPYGFALGAMGGYTLEEFPLYIGGRYMYFIGSSESSTGGRPPVPTEASANYMHIAAEGGWDMWAGDLIIRPGLLIGMALGFYERQGAGEPFSDNIADLMFSPGFMVAYPMETFFIAGDLRGNLVTGDGVSGVGLNVIAGARFE